MTFEVLTTINFWKELKVLTKKYLKIKKDVEDLEEDLKKNPQQGEPVTKKLF